MAPGRIDRTLDETTVSEQFPELPVGSVRRWSEGWDNELFLVGDDLVFRFPKRADCVPWLSREVEMMPRVAAVLDRLVPRFEWYGEPSTAFPYPFVGYRRQPGVGADDAGAPRPSPALAGQLGEAFSRVHGLDPEGIPPPPENGSRGGAELMGRMGMLSERVSALLEPALSAKVSPYLRRSLEPPAATTDLRFTHNDVCPDHVLVEPSTGELTGLIDWSDAIVGDPVMDFVGLIGIGDRAFVATVLANYRLPLDDGFDARLDWWTKMLTLTWLAEAASDDPAQVGKHLAWLRRAFADDLPLTDRR